jgi:cytochrome P450
MLDHTHDVDVTRVLGVEQDLVDDPYPTWAALRTQCPVYREPRFNVVVVTRYDDIVEVARRPQDFSSLLAAYGPNAHDRGDVPAAVCALAQRAGTPEAAPPGTVAALLASYRADIQDQLQHVDPPLHTHHRRIVSRWFTPASLAAREPAVREIARGLLDRLAGGGRVEILDAFAGPFPATVVAELIGIPPEHRELFLDWKEEVIGNPEAEHSRVTSVRYRQIRALFGEFIAARREHPGDDMITTLVQARTTEGEPLDDVAILGLLMLFLGGGQETTAKALTTGLRLLGDRPSLQDALRAEPARIPAFVEEVLRYDPPVRGIFRVAVRDTTIGGVPVAEGSLVQILWASGNRDAEVFADADTFDPWRTEAGALERPFLTFGHGIHLCPGAPLARLQLRVAFEELLARFSDIRLVPGQPYRYFRSQILRGLAGLWLDLTPAA